MNINSNKEVSFDGATTSAMGKAFDNACKSLRNLGCTCEVRDLIAKRIIDAATSGERDPARLMQQALLPFGVEDLSMVFVGVGRDPPVSAYTLVTQAA